MAESTTLQESGQPASRKMKLAGRGSYGKIPKVFVNNDTSVVKMEFDIHDFANLEEQTHGPIHTGIIKAHDHRWKLRVIPRGDYDIYADHPYVTIGLVYDGENTHTDPVAAKAWIRTKTTNHEITKFEFSKGINTRYCHEFPTQKDMIQNDCNNVGTLTITVELQVATEKRSVWFPQLMTCDYGQLYHSRTETSDVTFIIGTSRVEFLGHKCILFLQARVLYELGVTEEEGSSSSSKNNVIALADVDEKVFEILWKFIYTGKVPTLDDDEEELAKLILLAANRFGVTELKLYMESILVEKFLVPSKAAGLLLFADSYICPLLKEESMCMYASNSNEVMESNNNDDWTKIIESSKLLLELLVFTNSDRKQYLPAVDNDNTIFDDVDDCDVTSLRERLQMVTLDVDGSREILVQRWKDYCVRANNNKEAGMW